MGEVAETAHRPAEFHGPRGPRTKALDRSDAVGGMKRPLSAAPVRRYPHAPIHGWRTLEAEFMIMTSLDVRKLFIHGKLALLAGD